MRLAILQGARLSKPTIFYMRPNTIGFVLWKNSRTGIGSDNTNSDDTEDYNNNFNSPFRLYHQAIANYGPTHTSVRNTSGIAIEITK